MTYIIAYPKADNALREWYEEFQKLEITLFNELKSIYENASLVKGDRVFFNIKGNKFRLVVRGVFEFKVVQIKWFGTHAEYDKIDVNTVSFKK